MHIRTKKRPERYRLQFDSHQKGHQKGVQLMTCPDISHGGMPGSKSTRRRGHQRWGGGERNDNTKNTIPPRLITPVLYITSAASRPATPEAGKAEKKKKKKWRPAFCGAMNPQRRDPHKARENAGKDGVSRGHMRGTSSGVL